MSTLARARAGGAVGIHPAVVPVAFTLAAMALAVVCARAVVSGYGNGALVLGLLPLLAWLFMHPRLAAITLGAAIPAAQIAAARPLGLNVSLADLLLVFIAAAIVGNAVVTSSAAAVRALRAVALPVLQYVAVMLVLLLFHLGFTEVVETGQRLQLFLLPLLAGAFAAFHGWHLRVLRAYILAATALAVLWPIAPLGMQKNPTGQVIAAAIILLAGVRPLRPLYPCLPVLVAGLFLTQSRGAILAAGIGVALVTVVTEGNRPRVLLTRALPVLLVAAAAFALMPSSVQRRVTTFDARGDSRAAYALRVRDAYAQDAYRIIDDHPWTGTGVGTYVAGSEALGTRTADPHQVLLLQAAEGGYGLAASFVILVGGTAIALAVRMRRVDVGPAAVAVLLATAAQGLVDVYWVRGTPVLGWLVVGMACGGIAAAAHRGGRFVAMNAEVAPEQPDSGMGGLRGRRAGA